MKLVTIYTTTTCAYCKLAKEYFQKNNITYQEFDVGLDLSRRQEMIDKSGQMGVPVIEVSGNILVGFNKAKLENLLSTSPDVHARKINSQQSAHYVQASEKTEDVNVKSVTKFTPNTEENIKIILQILFGLFILWIFFGGLLEEKGNTNTVTIDCTLSAWKNDPLCSGEYGNQEQEYKENQYYQNMGR